MNKFSKNDVFLVATHNKGKAEEFKDLFSSIGVATLFSSEFKIAEPEETGTTFKQNSIIKARSCSNLGYNVISDDSGLCVECLKGKPGIFSARWSKKYGGWYNAMNFIYQKILETKSNNFAAKYYCVLSILWKDGSIKTYSGSIVGSIVWPPRGLNGFGYDPFFQPVGGKKTFGEMQRQKKMSIDHRSVAFKKILKHHYLY